jgi:hypothetical protein
VEKPNCPRLSYKNRIIVKVEFFKKMKVRKSNLFPFLPHLHLSYKNTNVYHVEVVYPVRRTYLQRVSQNRSHVPVHTKNMIVRDPFEFSSSGSYTSYSELAS